MPSLADLRVDLTGWTPEQHSESEAHWLNAAGDLLSIHFFDLPPDLPVALEDLAGLRASYRDRIRKAGGGIVEVDTLSLAGLHTVRTVFKFPLEPRGMAYVGSLTLPFAECSYVLKVQCPERGTTGLRDSTVLAQAMAEMKFTTHAELQRWMAEEWFQDPYDPADRGQVRRNRSDDPRYDKLFPDHPLSRMRRYMAHLERSLQVSPALLHARPFTSPSTSQASASPASALELLPDPRRHHYEFAHRAMPHLFLKDPEQFLGALHQGGTAFLERVWGFIAKDIPAQEVVAPDGLGVKFQVDSDSIVAVVTLPPVRAVAEALMVGCHYWTSPHLRQAARAPARYFTLELGSRMDGTLRTVLCEWEIPWNHSNYNDGPRPTPEDFVASIRAHVQRPA